MLLRNSVVLKRLFIFSYKSDTDTEMVQLLIINAKTQNPIGAIHWFAVHPTSMSNTNCLVSSDNVGYASILMETSMDETNLPGKVGKNI